MADEILYEADAHGVVLSTLIVGDAVSERVV